MVKERRKKPAKVEVLNYTKSPLETVAMAARLCYSPTTIEQLEKRISDKDQAQFVGKLFTSGHLSPFEHISFTFGIEGVSRALTHQLVRHRMASPSQQSQRYVNMEGFEFITPPTIRRTEQLNVLYREFMGMANVAYQVLAEGLLEALCAEYWLDMRFEDAPDKRVSDTLKETHPEMYKTLSKKAYEDARYVLPNACETKIIMTFNARSLFNFFRLRTCFRSQWEIRELAEIMLEKCLEIAPEVFQNSGAGCTFGECEEMEFCDMRGE